MSTEKSKKPIGFRLADYINEYALAKDPSGKHKYAIISGCLEGFVMNLPETPEVVSHIQNCFPALKD